MKKIKSWADINIEKYVQLHNVLKEDNTESENLDVLIKQLSIIYDLSEIEVENIHFT